ncbi:MAG: ABC transporter substrate-binding protein [Thiomargarita sp.]|nr:ABC transporter substrate-binding protein [Thiomargarita sp.]
MKAKIFISFAIILSILVVLIAYYDYLREYGKSIHIAFVGPMSSTGQLMTKAIELYIDKINERGGINGKDIVLTIYDDKNESAEAKLQALKIAEENQAVAVIGHWYSSASISAGKIYKQYQIPAITPGSTSIDVTKNNEWYFRNVYNANIPSQFLANYVKYVFEQNNVSIISEKSAYGSHLAKGFLKEAQKLNLDIKYHWQYDNKATNLAEQFANITQELKANEEKAGIILLAVQANEAVQLVKLIKDKQIQNRIIGGSSLSEKTFSDGFDSYPISQEFPGFYTNDIYVATPLMFDTANEKAQQFFADYQTKYSEIPDDWSAAYAYDTIMILLEAIKRANIQGSENTIKEDRQKIRDTLANFTNLYSAIEGVTGFNYFDNSRDAQKPVSLGIYKHKRFVSALTQLQIVRNPSEIAQAHLKQNVLKINDKYMYKTNVVYVGLDVLNINSIDVKKLEFDMEFKLWFRYQGDFDPQNIEFTNAINHKKLKEQLQTACKKKQVKNIFYSICRINGTFRADFIDDFYAYKQHLVGISFRHHSLTRNHLIYVTDILGMGVSKDESLTQRIAKSHVINPLEGWKISRVLFFSNIMQEFSAGNPEYLEKPEGKVEYSGFNVAIQIKKDQLTLRGILAYQHAYHIMVISGILFIILTLLGNKTKYSRSTWFFQVICAFILLLSGEIIFAEWLANNTSFHQMIAIIKMFDILWWIIPAYLLNSATERFIWTPLEAKTGPFPIIIRHFFAMIIYFSTFIGIIVFVYEQTFTSLLAASSVIVMIIGLAIQINISNVFSGVIINIERPFMMGDWITISHHEEGKVVDINWRATRLQLRNGSVMSIPNSIAAEATIINYHYPDNHYWLWPLVYIHPRYSPVKIKKILLDALLSSNKIIQDPKPIVFFKEINEWAACYWVAFCTKDYAEKYFILEEVWTRVWFHLNRSNISPAVMRQEMHFFKGDKDLINNLQSNEELEAVAEGKTFPLVKDINLSK